MKTHIKLIRISLVFAGIFLVSSIWYLYKKDNTYKPNPIRPDDFPKILVVPEGAVSIDYSTPTRQVPHVYGLSFIVNDPYPSETTRNFIEKYLKSKGWKKLKYHCLNPDVPTEYPNITLYKFYQDANELDEYTREKCKAPKPQEGEWPLRWMEDWLSKNDERISIFLGYVPNIKDINIPPTEENLDLNRLAGC